MQIPPPALEPQLAAATAADAPMALGDAEYAGLATIYPLPGGTQIVTNDAEPVALRVPAEGWTFTVTDLEGRAQGRTVVYGPLSGDVVIRPGTTDVPEVTVDGGPVAPVRDTGGEEPADGGQPGDGGGGAGGGGAPEAGPGLTAAVRGGKLAVTRKGVVRVRVSGGPARGELVLRARLGRRTVRTGRGAVALGAAGEARVAVRLSAPARATLRRRTVAATATLTLRDAAGRTATGTAAVRLRRSR